MKHLKLLAPALLYAVTISCTHHEPVHTPAINKEEVSSELANLWAEYLVAWKAGDAEKCLSFMTAEDYVNMPSYDATQNFQETREMFINVFENNIIESADYKQIEVFVHEDMAYEFGLLYQVWIGKASGDTAQLHNRCISVWKKTDDGAWKLQRWLAQD